MTAPEAHPKLDQALKSLQPIRDLARNWDVDIAQCLQEYLEEFNELEVISQQTQQEHPEEEASTPNFAQAALLLHQSSNVYSRKVEYLYTLVYAALNSLVNSSANSKNGKSPSKKRVDAEIAEFDDFDQQVNFLLLDDVMPTDEDGVKINLASAKNGNHAGLNLDASLFNATTTRLSLGGLTRADQTSTASQYHHQQAAILSTLVGSDAGLGILQNTGSQNGIFYMRGTASQQAAAPQQQERRASSFGGGNILNLSGAASSPMQQHDDGDGGGFYDGGGDDDDHMEGPGFQLAAEDDAPMDGGAQPPPPVMQQVKKAKNDPWHLLDPHDAETTKVRSLRMGSTFVLPAGLDPLGTTKASSKQRHHAEVVVESVAEPVCIATAAFKATMANEQRRRERLSISGEASNISDTSAISTPAIEPVIVVPMKGLAFGDEFAYIAKANNKRKAAAQRERRKLLLVKPSAVPQQEADQLMGYDDHYGGDDDDNSFGGDDDDGAGFQAFDDGNQYEAAENDTSNPDGAAFEALCRAHIRAFARGAEKYKAETNLTKRVGDWQSRLAPVLEEEAQRPEFDIHVYGAHVIDTIEKTKDLNSDNGKPNKTRVIEFHSVTRDKKQYDVCRLFLASLSLCNSGNVRFTAPEGQVMTPDTLHIELLKSAVDRPMQTYLAPSAMDGQ